jgi:hypothetical protein
MPPEPASILICASPGLRDRLTGAFDDVGRSVVAANSHDEALAALRGGRFLDLVCEARRDAFAHLVKMAVLLNPAMPIQLIDGGAVFCLYPLARQPHDLLEAIRAAGVSISPHLLRHAGHAPPPKANDAYLVA